MSEIPENVMKALGQSFPTMNVLPSIGKTGRAKTKAEREIKGYRISLELGIGNAYVTGIEKIEE
jgi:hypothetical protein